ncbi:MAG: lactate dehydrogenase [Megasphaera sp.]|uniref:lactate/malate family dehydrogenase n=1 Tax=Megasphaera sp. TaxID=2023260 RepID=UPI0025BDFC2A|nr:lactate dehydrogenase [Megasphaera sp.]MCF0152000.1 lactate dehydrogenase [Megasphaera sp.]MCI7599660.1 lactate dehydrogenase [Megasphaera sp.]
MKNLNKWIHDLPAEIGAAVMPLDRAPQLARKARVHIVALGDVGTTMLIGLLLAGQDVIRSVGMCDINEKNLARLEMEMNQIRYPFAGQEGCPDPVLPSVTIVGEADVFDCDVFIFCASKGVPPVGAGGDVRMAQLEANRSLIAHYASLARQAGFGGQVCIVSDPVDPLCYAFLRESGLHPAQIQGYGLGVMHARACYYARKNPRFAHYLTEGRAFGPHGADLVIADRLDGYDDALSKELTDLVVHANVAVRDLGYKPYIAPALSSAALSIILTLRGQWHYGSVYLGDASKGAFFGVKNRVASGCVTYEDVCACPALYERWKRAYTALSRIV